jgi:hypothetical protein
VPMPNIFSSVKDNMERIQWEYTVTLTASSRKDVTFPLLSAGISGPRKNRWCTGSRSVMAQLAVHYIGCGCHFHTTPGWSVALWHLQHQQQVRLHIKNKQIHSVTVLLPKLLTVRSIYRTGTLLPSKYPILYIF